MQAQLSFTLPEEQEELDIALKAGSYKQVLWEMDNYLRERIKYEELPKDVEHALRLARQKLHDFASDYHLSI